MRSPSPTPPPRTLDQLVPRDLLDRLDRLDVLSRKVFAGKLPGERHSKRRGRSIEFDDFRTYTPGDDLRHIDWNIYARLDRLFIKLYRAEEDLAVHILIDASPSMDAGEPGKLVFAQRLALALGYIALVNQNRLMLSVFGAPGRPALQRPAAMRGRRSLPKLVDLILHAVHPPPIEQRVDEPASFPDAMRALARSRRAPGVMIILSDFLFRGDWTRGLGYLAGGAARGVSLDATCLHILSPGELDPAREVAAGLAGDLRLTDAETGAAAEVTLTAPVIARYRARLAAHIDAVRRACAARTIAHLLVPSDTDLPTLLLDYLRRRGLVG